MTLREFQELLAARGCNPGGEGPQISAICPAHDDRRASLSVSEGDDGRLLIHCHAGCSGEAVCAALGITMADLGPPKARGTRQIVAAYDYRDANGKMVFQVVRFAPKDFQQRRPDPNKPGEWLWNLKGVQRVLFRLPELKAAILQDQTIYVAEGEKDVLALESAGFHATCNSGGAGKWRPEYTETLSGADVVIIADKDKAGRNHAQTVAGRLQGTARRVRVLELPDVQGRPVKDAHDYIAAGGPAGQIRAIADAAPEWIPKQESGAQPDADAELVTRYGEPVFYRGEGAVSAVNERFFAARFHRARRVLFEPAERAFYEYAPDSGLWRGVSDDHVREALSAHVLEYGRTHDITLDSKITGARMAAVLQALRGIAETHEAFVKHSDFVHVANGVIRFGDDARVTLTEYRPDDYSRNRCSVPFSHDADCPRFLEFLRAALSDHDVDLLQRLAGLALAGVNPAQRIVILDGQPASGKSTFARIMRSLVGTDNCAQLRTDLLFERFEVFRFVGRTLLLAPDVPGDFLGRPAASVLKALVGGDPLTAEAKGGNGVFALTGNFNVLITSNSRLRVRLDGDAGAWRRRLIIIRFEKRPPGRRIPNLADELFAKEGPGILRWALAGCVQARGEIAETGDLSLSVEQQARVDALLSESDSLRRFIRECTEAGDGDVTTAELIEGYFRFCADREWTPQPVRTVERTLKDMLLETYGVSQSHDIKRNGGKPRGWHGVVLKLEVHPERTKESPLPYADD